MIIFDKVLNLEVEIQNTLSVSWALDCQQLTVDVLPALSKRTSPNFSPKLSLKTDYWNSLFLARCLVDALKSFAEFLAYNCNILSKTAESLSNLEMFVLSHTPLGKRLNVRVFLRLVQSNTIYLLFYLLFFNHKKYK